MATTPQSVPVTATPVIRVFVELRVGDRVLSPGAVEIGEFDAKVTRTAESVDVDQAALAQGLAQVLNQAAADARFNVDVVAARAARPAPTPGGAP